MAIDKSIKPANLVPRSFGGEKNNFSDDLIASGFEPNTPETYNGDNLNYQLDATGKELDYCEKVVDYINGLGVGKTPIVNANNKLDETQVGLKVYSATETYSLGEWVRSGDKIYQSLTQSNLGNDLTNETYWKEVELGGSGYRPPLLSCMWADHQLNDIQWLRGDTFSWQNGVTYSQAYNLLLEENNNTASTEQTENGITFKVTPRGFRIADATQEQAILDLYNTTGVAWYYILDPANTRFKLPRTKYGFVGLRDSVGGYVAESLPNDNATVQQRATQMYLYFYVGEYTQSAIEQTAGLNSDLFNGKMDRDLSNISSNIHFVTETYQNEHSWYRVWSDGFVEQGGIILTMGVNSYRDITLLKPYEDVKFSVIASFRTVYTRSWGNTMGVVPISNSQFRVAQGWYGDTIAVDIQWRACGYTEI